MKLGPRLLELIKSDNKTTSYYHFRVTFRLSFVSIIGQLRTSSPVQNIQFCDIVLLKVRNEILLSSFTDLCYISEHQFYDTELVNLTKIDPKAVFEVE